MDHPICDALLFADRAIQETNGKHGLIGIFDQFNFPGFPSPPIPVFFLFIALRNIEAGKHQIAVNITLDDSAQVVAPINGEMEVRSKQLGVSLVLPVAGLVFHKSGTYSVTVHIDGTFIHSKPLTVNDLTQQQLGQ